jgi:hypothetical protein
MKDYNIDQNAFGLVVNEFKSKNKMFTKFDVTRKLREKYHVTHSKVKGFFKSYDVTDSGDYESSFIYTPYVCSLFHPIGADITAYEQDNTDDNGNITVSVNSSKFNCNIFGTVTRVKPVSNDEPDVKEVSFGSDKRFYVPSDKVKEAGFSKGMTVYINTDSDENKIFITSNGTGRKTTVHYNNIRIPVTEFETAFGNIPQSVKINIDNNQIEITNL